MSSAPSMQRCLRLRLQCRSLLRSPERRHLSGTLVRHQQPGTHARGGAADIEAHAGLEASAQQHEGSSGNQSTTFRKHSGKPLHLRQVKGSYSSSSSSPRDREPSGQELQPTTKVRLDVDGRRHAFSPILLRDLCACPQCVDPSTKQKYRPTTDIPAQIRAREISNDPGAHSVRIRWENDVAGYDENHATDIDLNTLRDYIRVGRTGVGNFEPPSRKLWDAAEYGKIQDLSYEEYMQSDPSLHRILQQLHTHGLAFVTDVPESEQSVSNIAERIGPIKNTFYGYTWDVRSVPESRNVAYTNQDLGFHMDLLYMEQPPHLQFLHCIRSSSAGGASLFTDSFRAASDLLHSDTRAFEILRKYPVNFHYNHPSTALYHYMRPVLEFGRANAKGGPGRMVETYRRADANAAEVNNPIDHLTAVAWSPPFQAPFGNRLGPDEQKHPVAYANGPMKAWHTSAQQFSMLIHRSEMIYERMMKPGECVLFDNRRVLHARKAFELGDVGKERWLRGAYLDKDPYMSKMRVLQHQMRSQVAETSQHDADYFEAAAATS